MMYAKAFTLAVLASTVAAEQWYQHVPHNFGAMLKRGEAIAKRQGYYPTSTPCGEGDTCAEACGAGQVECPANVGRGVCFDPAAAACCPDGSGYPCDNGYFCTTDGRENTYCCPDGLDLVSCAEQYSLTVSLISQTGSISIPSETGSSVLTTRIHVSVSESTPSPVITSPVSSTPSPSAPINNGSYTTSAPVQFPGGAGKVAGAGMAVLAGAVGIAGLL